MATPFDNIVDLALIGIRDYKLDKLFNYSHEDFTNYCDSFLIRAIPNFFRCKQSLEYDMNNRAFISDLTSTEQSILADFWVISWVEKEVQDARALQATLQVSSAFSTHSQSQFLKEKKALLDNMYEKVYQKITDYLLQDIATTNIFEGW